MPKSFTARKTQYAVTEVGSSNASRTQANGKGKSVDADLAHGADEMGHLKLLLPSKAQGHQYVSSKSRCS